MTKTIFDPNPNLFNDDDELISASRIDAISITPDQRNEVSAIWGSSGNDNWLAQERFRGFKEFQNGFKSFRMVSRVSEWFQEFQKVQKVQKFKTALAVPYP